MSRIVLEGAAVVTPDAILPEGRVAVADGCIVDGREGDAIDLGGGYLLPGFIDTQVNGGGGVLFNDAPSVEGIAALAEAHRRYGTTGIMPTIISDDLSVIASAIAATDEAIAEGVPGVLGLHIEGPFINVERRGIHDARFMRELDDEALAVLTSDGRGARIVTLAPETVQPGTIRRLHKAGLIVAAGHSTADYDETRAALAEGLDGFTHLFNAMTQFSSRAPGMVGAALEDRNSRFGLIVDGHHVHPAALRVAIAARGIDGAMLVTDAMPPAGTDMRAFSLQGRQISVESGTLRGGDGTLAGSALTMDLALRNAMDLLGLDLVASSRLASGNPAAFLRMTQKRGAIAPGRAADLVHLDDDFCVRRVWIGGKEFPVGQADGER